MQNKKPIKRPARRKLLKALATGGGVAITAKSVPKNWARPTVESVVLPAHAQATTCIDSGPVLVTLDFSAAPTIQINLGFAQFGPETFTPPNFSIDLDAPNGCTGGGNISGTINGGVSGTLVSSFTCSTGPSCTDFELNFSAPNQIIDNVFAGTWTATGSIGCCEYLVPLNPD